MRTFTVVPSFEGESAFFELPDIGFQGDHLSFAILFNLTELTEHWPNILPSMIVTNPKGETFIAPHTRWNAETHIFTWLISSTETTYDGYVKCQLKCMSADDPETIVCMSRICQTRVFQSLEAATDPPEAFQSWIDTLTQLGAEISADATVIFDSVEATETNARSAQAAADEAAIHKNAAQQARNQAEQVTQIATAAQQGATQAQQRAQQAATNAESAMQAAGQAQALAEQALEEADAAVTTASTSASSAADSASQAAASMNQSIAAKNASESAKDLSVNARDAAVIAQQRAEEAEANAQIAQGAARSSETNAVTAASNAAASETNAATSASNAAASETNAANSAIAASEYATSMQNAVSDAEAARDRSETAMGRSEAAAQTLLNIKGSANGLAELDSAGKVPTSQLPSYVDDVLEYDSSSLFPVEGETGKIYIAKNTGYSYRWSGSQYVQLSTNDLATQSASGLMSAEDKLKLDGIAAGATNNTVENVLDSTSETNALSAAQGKVLNETKKGLQNAVSDPAVGGTDVNFISGITQDEQGVISPVKKTVRTFTGATEQNNGSTGLVPAPSANNQNKFLKADGTWDDVPDPQVMTGATSSTAGSAGLTPVPAAGDQNKFLKADGTWDDVPDPQVMTGATSSIAGTAGLTPTPAAGDQDKVLKGSGTWGLPGVVTINGRSPNPVTGDIVIIEGGGSSSYGSYRLDAVITPNDWTENNGSYMAQVANQYITANMDGIETWLDNSNAMLGETTFTTSAGMLTITTTVQPTLTWNLHVSLAVNGADVLANVSQLQTAVDSLTTTVNDGFSNVQDSLAIVANGDSHIAIAEGQYVYVKNHNTLPDGLYKSNAAIEANGTLTTSNLIADSTGGLNALDAHIRSVRDSLDAKIDTETAAIQNTKAGIIYNTIDSVSVASFDNGADNLPVKELEVTIELVQDLHGYDHPWSGGRGKNLVDITKIVQGGISSSDGSVTNSSTRMVTDFIPVEPNTTYVASFGGDLQVKSARCYDSNKNAIGSNFGTNNVITTTADAHYVRFTIGFSSGSDIDISISDIIDPQFELGSTATSYVPYTNICPITGRTGINIYHSGADTSNPDTLSISFSSSAGTVYGGTLDVVRGLLTVYMAEIASYAGETLSGEWISDRDVYAAGATPTTGAQVVYPLATPITYQLTPTEIRTLLGVNNIRADIGDIDSITYPVDTKLAIDGDISHLADGLAIVANGDIHAAVAKDQFVYVRNHDTLADGLYKAKANISANAALTTSNLAVDTNGGLNALKSDVDALNSKLGYDIGSKSMSEFQTEIETKLIALNNGKSFTFKVDLTDGTGSIASGTYTGIAVRSADNRYNVILQRSGSSVCATYVGSLTSNGWVWGHLSSIVEAPTNPTYVSSLVVSSYNNRVYVCKYGNVVTIGGEFKAAATISSNATVIATGFPPSWANSLGQFTAIHGTSAVHLDIDSNGQLTTFYAGEIAANEIVRYGFTYLCK